MDVEQWLEENGSSKAWLARKLGIQPSRLYSYLSGSVRVPLYVVQQTHKLSRGKVSLFDWTAEPIQRAHASRGSLSTVLSDPPAGGEVEQGTGANLSARGSNTRARS